MECNINCTHSGDVELPTCSFSLERKYTQKWIILCKGSAVPTFLPPKTASAKVSQSFLSLHCSCMHIMRSVPPIEAYMYIPEFAYAFVLRAHCQLGYYVQTGHMGERCLLIWLIYLVVSCTQPQLLNMTLLNLIAIAQQAKFQIASYGMGVGDHGEG